MSTKKYSAISIPTELVKELQLWNKSYELAGKKLTMEKMLQQMIHANRKMIWRNNKDRDVVILYNAQILSSKKNISLKRAVKLVKAFDEDTNSLNTGITSPIRYSEYVYDKDIRYFDYWWTEIKGKDLNDL